MEYIYKLRLKLNFFFNQILPSFREFLCCSFKTIGSLPERKNAICPIFSRNCLTKKKMITKNIETKDVNLPFSSVSTDVNALKGEISTSGT